MRPNWKTGLVALSLVCLANPLPAMAACADARDVAALKTAALQQRLMVAAFTCHDTAAYNRFVITYRPELQRSDADLKAFFLARGGEHGEADYDSYKTKLANLSALNEATDSAGYCRSEAHEYADAFRNAASLDLFAAAEKLPMTVASVCAAPVLAAAQPVTEKPVRVASANIAAGAPALPAMPYGESDTAAPSARAAAHSYNRDEDDVMPPRPQRASRDEGEYGDEDQDDIAPPPAPPYAYEIHAQRPWPRRRWYPAPPPPGYVYYYE